MVPMGTWYALDIVNDQKSGDADKFEWGMAPIPQNPDAKKSDKAVTFGDPTGFAVSSKATGQKLAAAKEFVKFCSGEEGAKVLAAVAITPAYLSDAVKNTFFSVDGMAVDDLSKKAGRIMKPSLRTRSVRVETPSARCSMMHTPRS